MKSVLILFVFCAVVAKTQSENGYNGRPYRPFMEGFTRIKRVKYSNTPQRFYSRPPSTFPVSGTFSYTPPPGYMMDNDESLYPGNLYPEIPRPKVSKRPNNEGLKEEDLQNFVKYLSKQNIDKILEYAGHNRDSTRIRGTYEEQNNVNYRPDTNEYNNVNDPKMFSPKPDDDGKIFRALVQEIDLDLNQNQQTKPNKENSNILENYKIDRVPFYAKYNDYQDTSLGNNINTNMYATDSKPQTYIYSDPSNQIYNNNMALNTQKNAPSPTKYSNIDSVLTENDVIPEEYLPRPVNLRDSQDIDVAYTHKVPAVLKAEPSYKVESFGDLPLMDYSSKLDKLSSYHVPHYTVTSSTSSLASNAESSSSYAVPSSSSYSSSSSVPVVEPAPPPSAAKEQSDAHLKAIRIWSHKSKGTAYTLHDDGTLSLERPGRPGSYGA